MILEYVVKNLSLYKTVRQVLKIEFNMSNRLITKLKKNKCILLNGNETYLDKMLSINDVISCDLNCEESSDNIIPTKMDLNIIYEDDSLLVIKLLISLYILLFCIMRIAWQMALNIILNL